MSKNDMKELQKTIDNIKLNRPAYTRDGITFENNYRIFPNSQRLDTGSGPYKEWVKQNPKFTKADLQSNIKNMMKQYNIPKSSRNFAKKYGCK